MRAGSKHNEPVNEKETKKQPGSTKVTSTLTRTAQTDQHAMQLRQF